MQTKCTCFIDNPGETKRHYAPQILNPVLAKADKIMCEHCSLEFKTITVPLMKRRDASLAGQLLLHLQDIPYPPHAGDHTDLASLAQAMFEIIENHISIHTEPIRSLSTQNYAVIVFDKDQSIIASHHSGYTGNWQAFAYSDIPEEIKHEL